VTPAPASAAVPLPTPAQVERRLAQILAADSAQTGGGARTARLMLMLTRSCELRCSYCFVALREDEHGLDHPGAAEPDGAIPRGDMHRETARRAIDRLVTSDKPRLGLQLFGGEPSRRWDVLLDAVAYLTHHPGRRARPLEVLLTTNGLGLDAARLDALRAFPVVVQLSVDGFGEGNRFRRPHLLSQTDADRRWEAALPTLRGSGIPWFLNVTLPPAAAGEIPARSAAARAQGVPAIQLNYATGMRWTDEQVAAYLTGLWQVLRADRAAPGAMTFYNWNNAADPAPLCGDTIVDVDGTLLQVGGIFHERRFPGLRRAYRHGHLDDAAAFGESRATLADLWARTRAALTPDEAEVFAGGMRLGAAVDIVCRLARRG
jgi:hypothetical protein